MKDKEFKFEPNDDECLLLDSKHYETIEHTIEMYWFDAYDEKGNKIECERIILKPKIRHERVK